MSSIMGWFGKVYTSSYILDELLTFTKMRVGANKAIDLAETLRTSNKITTLKVEEKPEILADAFVKFRKYADVTGLSFTDCTTLTLRETNKIGSLLSFERNFRTLVPRLVGENYQGGLSRGQQKLLARVAKKYRVPLEGI